MYGSGAAAAGGDGAGYPHPDGGGGSSGYSYGAGGGSGGAFGAFRGSATTTPSLLPPPRWPVSAKPAQQGGVQAQLRRWWDTLNAQRPGRRRPNADNNNKNNDKKDDDDDWVSRLCFFSIAVAYKTPWTAVSSLLGQLAALHGPRVLLGLNLAYFLPSIPVLLAHAAAAGGGGGNNGGGSGNNANTTNTNPSFESRLGVPTAAALRLLAGLGGLACVSAILMPPLCAASGPLAAALLLAATAGSGALYGVAFGASYSLAARRCAPKGATVALSTGFVACGGVVLAVDVAVKRGAPDYTRQGLASLFRAVAGTCLLGVAASAVLLRRQWDALEADEGGGGGRQDERQQQRHAFAPPSSSWRALLSSSSSPAAAAAAVRSVVRVALLLPPNGGPLGRRGGGGGGGGNTNDADDPLSSLSPSSSSFGVGSPTHNGGGGGAPLRQRALGAESMALMTTADGRRRGRRAGGSSSGGGWAGESSALPVFSSASSAAADDEAAAGNGHHCARGGKQHLRTVGGGGSSSSSSNSGLSLRRLAALFALDPALAATARRAAPAALALAVSVGTSMLAFPFFTYTSSTDEGDGSLGNISSGGLGRALPQALFYARLAGDVGGRVLTPRLGVAGPRSLVAWALAKAALLPLLLAALLHPELAGGDYGLCAVVFGYWALSGAVNTSAYVVAPLLVPASDRAQAGAVMALCFQAACFAGLAGAGVLQAVMGGPPPGGGAGEGGGEMAVEVQQQQQQ